MNSKTCARIYFEIFLPCPQYRQIVFHQCRLDENPSSRPGRSHDGRLHQYSRSSLNEQWTCLWTFFRLIRRQSKQDWKRDVCPSSRNYPCLALKRGLVLLITYNLPRLRTTLQSGCLFLRVLMEDTTFIKDHYALHPIPRQRRIRIYHEPAGRASIGIAKTLKTM